MKRLLAHAGSEFLIGASHGLPARDIGLVQQPQLVCAECDLERCHGFIDMMRLRRADDWRRDAGLVQHPGKRDLARFDTASSGASPAE
jgi:hypothetical protein